MKEYPFGNKTFPGYQPRRLKASDNTMSFRVYSGAFFIDNVDFVCQEVVFLNNFCQQQK
jgi:hypothetical protein